MMRGSDLRFQITRFAISDLICSDLRSELANQKSEITRSDSEICLSILADLACKLM